jgi:major intracellular serine protease
MKNEMKLVPFKINSIDDSAADIPYGIVQLKAPEIWEQGEKGEGIVVAILDTGIDLGHPDLRDKIAGGINCVDKGATVDDDNGHGTHVAGIISGVAPEAKLLICKVLDGKGSGSYHSIIQGIKYASQWRGSKGERVRVINMSLGGSYNDPKMYKAILEAAAEGILIAVASGNEGDANPETFEYGYPALYQECITVAACDENMKLAGFSNEHLQVDIIAAGVNVKSTYPKSKYAVLSGTSMATPHIAGALALVIKIGEKQFRRSMEQSEIYALLVKCCCSLGYQKSSEGNGIPELSKINEHC